MATCKINTDTVRNGITSLIKREINKGNIVVEKDGRFSPKSTQPSDIQPFINNINSIFSADVIKKSGNDYIISIPDSLIKDYIVVTEDGRETIKLANAFYDTAVPNESRNKGEMGIFLLAPEISEVTYDKLKSFLLSINPKFKIETIDNLSTDGLTELKKFLVSVRTTQRLSGISEEVAHVLIELLPDDNPLKKQLIDNITSFPIYSLTLTEYKEKYVKDGKPDYDKIKREAAAKLVAEYIYAISENDTSRIDKLGKPKDNLLRRWFRAFLKWLGINLIEKGKIYADVATTILGGKNLMELKTEEEIDALDYTDSFFYKTAHEELYEDAETIWTAQPTSQLLQNMTAISRQFGRVFNDILKNEKLKALDEELKKEGTSLGKINRLLDAKSLFSEFNINIRAAYESDQYIRGIRQFLEAIYSMDTLADAILKVIRNKERATEVNKAIGNMTELNVYMGIYNTFNKLINNNFVNELVKMGVDPSLTNKILKANQSFQLINREIVARLENDALVFYRELFRETNSNVGINLANKLQILQKHPEKNRKEIEKIKKQMNNFIQSDERILNLLLGNLEDTDALSTINYYVNAARLNGDQYISSIAAYIEDKIAAAQQRSKPVLLTLLGEIHEIQKELGESADITGRFISQVEKVLINGEETEARMWLNPHKGIEIERAKLQRLASDAHAELFKVDRNDIEKYKAAAEDYEKKRKAYNEFLNKYSFRPFTKEWYTFREEFDKNPVFVTVFQKWKDKNEQISNLEGEIEAETGDITELLDSIAVLRRERNQLRSETDAYGNPKSPIEIEEAKILNKYFEESSKYTEIDYVQTERAFRIAKSKYQQKVKDALYSVRANNIKTIEAAEEKLAEILKIPTLRISSVYYLDRNENESLDYDLIEEILMYDWDKRNVTEVPNEAFYEYEREMYEKIKEIKSKQEQTEEEKLLTEIYELKRKILLGTRDNIGQINPAALTQEEKDDIITLDEKIAELRQKEKTVVVDFEKMTEVDRVKYEELTEKIKTLKGAAQIRAIQEKNKITRKYQDKKSTVEIKHLKAQLGESVRNRVTQYYWDKMDEMIPEFSKYMKEMGNKFPHFSVEERRALFNLNKELERRFTDAIDNMDEDTLFFDIFTKQDFVDFLSWLEDSNPHLLQWFKDNHIQKYVFPYRAEKGENLEYYPNSLYLYREPTMEKHRTPMINKKFLRYKVKDEYRTGYNPTTGQVELKVGVHISNRTDSRGRVEFLPLTPEYGEPADSPYRNQEYYRMKNSSDKKDQLRFRYLELLKKYHLQYQEKLPEEKRPWMKVPVMDLSNIESWKKVPTKAQAIWDNFRSAISGAFGKEDNKAAKAEAQLEDIETIEDINQITGEIIKDKLPKIGMNALLPIERVSTDLVKGVEEFIIRSFEFESRLELIPIMEGILTVMSNNEVGNAFRKGSNKQRIELLTKQIEQKLYQEIPSGAANTRLVRRVVSFITGNTALRMAFDPLGGIWNWGSATVNNLIEAAAGEVLSLQEYAKGKLLATQMLGHIASDFGKMSNLSRETLMFVYMDLLQGDFREDLLDRSSSIDKKSSIQQISMIPRTAGEIHAQSAIGLGIMDRTKVKNEIDGKEYPMHEIYEKQGNLLVLKKGFPNEWNPIDGVEFLKVQTMIHKVNRSLHGNYAKLSATEASRHAIGRMMENMKRWLMPAIQRRFGRESPDATSHDLEEGYYRTGWNFLISMGTAIIKMDNEKRSSVWEYYTETPQYKKNIQRFGMEIGLSFMMWLLFALVLGYSGDDKNKKLDSNSWIHNVSILILLRMYSETTSYLPIPTLGYQELKRNFTSPFSLPADAISNLWAVGQLMLYQGLYWAGADGLKDDLYYSKDAGFWYSEKGDSKLVKYILKTFGYAGYTFEPAQYIKTFDNMQKRLK